MESTLIRVLMIDGSSSDAALVGEALATATEARFTTHPARSLGDALAALDTYRRELILVDPGAAGVEGVHGVERLARLYPGLPIVVLASADSTHPGVHMIRAGAVDFLRKGWAMGGNAGAWRERWRTGTLDGAVIQGQETAALAHVLLREVERAQAHRPARTYARRPNSPAGAPAFAFRLVAD